MQKVILDMSMSLDGYIAGTNISAKDPIGEDGERLHDWIFAGKTETDTQILNELTDSSGAVIFGGKTFELAITDGWGGSSPFQIPAFVVTNSVPEKLVPGFTHVTEGFEVAFELAKEVAGDKNVWILGGAATAQQFIRAGLLDEIHIHLIPVLLCDGIRLFENIGTEHIELHKMRSVESAGVTHIYFRVVR